MAYEKRSAGGLLKGTIADIFMNFSLITTWLLFLSPPHPPVDAVPDQSIPPTEQNPGDRPAAGQEVARVIVNGDKSVTITYQSATYSFDSYKDYLSSNPGSFPDHIVFSFPEFSSLQTIGKTALEQDAAISLEISH